jgi:hypothetical protein
MTFLRTDEEEGDWFGAVAQSAAREQGCATRSNHSETKFLSCLIKLEVSSATVGPLNQPSRTSVELFVHCLQHHARFWATVHIDPHTVLSMDSGAIIDKKHVDHESSPTLSDIATENCFTVERPKRHKLNLYHH